VETKEGRRTWPPLFEGRSPSSWVVAPVAVVVTTRRHLPVRCARGGGRSRERGAHSRVTKGGLPRTVDTDQRVPQNRVPGGREHIGSLGRAKREFVGETGNSSPSVVFHSPFPFLSIFHFLLFIPKFQFKFGFKFKSCAKLSLNFILKLKVPILEI
jgi:hypothetical protein